MKLSNTVRMLFLSDRWLQRVLLAFMVIYYGVILCNPGLHKPTLVLKVYPLEMTFNSMIEHLAHGQFDVDPNAVGHEGFLRNGHIYAYWGITCALLRLPLFLFQRLDLNVTAWSCLIAVCLAGMMKIKTVLFLRRYCGFTPASEWAYGLMLAYIVLGGAEVGYLKSSIFQEVVFWAVAFAAIFIYFAVKGVVSGQFTAVALSWMALAAGLAMLTRVSTGLGLYTAFGLLLLVLLAEELHTRRAVFTRRFLIPVAIIVVFLVAVGTVNYYRWGNPWTFANYTYYIGNSEHPDRMPRMHLYGLFNPVRIPFGLSYYFVPLWALQGADGHLLFENTQTRLMDGVELPPSSFFLTDLLPIAFIVFLAIALWAKRHKLSHSLRQSSIFARYAYPLPASRLFSYAQALALIAGLAVPCLLMLMAIYMSYRYRMEFYPEIDFLAFLGLYATVSNPSLLARFNRCRHWMLAAAVVSIVSAFVALVLYKLSEFGSAQLLLRNGLVRFYLWHAWPILHHVRR